MNVFPGDRQARIDDVIRSVIARRLRGEQVTEADVLESHSDLLPELTEQFKTISAVMTAMAETSAAHDAPESNEVRDSKDSKETVNFRNESSINCPECSSRISLQDANESTSVHCDKCGSEFTPAKPPIRRAGIGHTIGQFELIEVLGKGGFGTVWKAFDPKLDRVVAIKIAHGGMSPSDGELFLREARATAQIHHPNIVPIHDVGRFEDQLYLVCDWIDGQTLAQFRIKNSPSLKAAASLVAQCASAMEFVHSSGIIHRDLKPGNILIDKQGKVFITDFGLARRQQGELTLTVEGTILGSPAYMSPEQARGDSRNVDARGDVYSLGVVLFELITGDVPFRAVQPAIFHQIESVDPPSPRKLNPAVSRDLETITLKCLEKSPASRYQTAQELADDLYRLTEGRPISARPIGPVARSVRWCGRNRVATAFIALLLITGIGGSLAAFAYRWKARQEEAAQHVAFQKTQEAVQSERRAKLARDDANERAREATTAQQKEKIAREKADRLLARTNRYFYAMKALSEDPRLFVTRFRHDSKANYPLGFEWYRAWRQCRSPIAGRFQIEAGARNAVLSSNDKWIAIWHNDGTIREWPIEVSDDPRPRTIAENIGQLLWLKYHPTKPKLAFLRDGRQLSIWNSTSQSKTTFELTTDDAKYTAIAFHPTFDTCYCFAPNEIVAVGYEAKSVSRRPAFVDMNFLPTVASVVEDGDTCFVGGHSAGRACVYEVDLNDSTIVSSCFIESEPNATHFEQFVRSLAISADSRTVYAGTEDGQVIRWKTPEKSYQVIGQAGLDLVYSAKNDELFASGSNGYDDQVDVFNSLGTHAETIYRTGFGDVAFTIVSPRATLFAGIPNANNGHVRIFHMQRSKRVIGHAPKSDVKDIVIGQDRFVTMLTTDGKIQQVDLGPGSIPQKGLRREFSRFQRLLFEKKDVPISRPVAIGTSPFAKEYLVLCETGILERWTHAENQRIGSEDLFVDEDVEIQNACFSDNGNRLLIGAYDEETKHATKYAIVSVPIAKVMKQRFDEWLRNGPIAISNDGKFVALNPLNADQGILERHVIDTEKRELIHWEQPLQTYPTTDASVSPDGRFLAYASQRSVIDITLLGVGASWDHEILKGTRNRFHCIAFSPDSRTLAEGTATCRVTGQPNAKVVLWDTATRERKLELETEPGAISCVRFSPDGSILVATHDSGKVYAWYAATPEEVAVGEAFEPSSTYMSSDELRAKWDGVSESDDGEDRTPTVDSSD